MGDLKGLKRVSIKMLPGLLRTTPCPEGCTDPKGSTGHGDELTQLEMSLQATHTADWRGRGAEQAWNVEGSANSPREREVTGNKACLGAVSSCS